MNTAGERTIGMILEKQEAQHETLLEIKQLVTKTNGRVQSLEKWRVGLSVGLGITAAMGIPNISTIAKILSGV